LAVSADDRAHFERIAKSERAQLVDPAILVAASPGVSPEYQLRPQPADRTILEIQERLQGRPFILHVGSCIPRKRIDVLLDTFAELRTQIPELHLVKVGGSWSATQQQQITQLTLERSIVHLTNLQNSTIARLYRQAKIVLVTSDAEGFGLPVIEGLACGAIVIASDIPVLREVGDDAVIYCPVGDIGEWTARALAAIDTPDRAPDPALRAARAAHYSWDNYARTIVAAYTQLGAGKL
jgi:glycosyltransferase involved in cell wall biosynthesis